MSKLTAEQTTVLNVLTIEGCATSWFIAKELTNLARGIRWSAPRVGRVMRQLKYRSLVEFERGTWRRVNAPTPSTEEETR